MTNSSERQELSLTQAQIDSLRQGQRLDTIDQNPKHDSSKTEVTLDAVMQEAEEKRGNRGNQEPQPKQKLPLKCIFPSHVQLSQNDALSKPFAQQVFSKIKQVSPLFDHFSQKFSPLLAHAHIKSKKNLKLPLKLKLHLNRCYAMSAMQEV